MILQFYKHSAAYTTEYLKDQEKKTQEQKEAQLFNTYLFVFLMHIVDHREKKNQTYMLKRSILKF